MIIFVNFMSSILEIELLLNAFTVDFSWAACSQSQSCYNILLKATFPQANIKMICIFPHALTGSWSHELFRTFYSEKLRKLLVNSCFLCWLFQTAQLLLARSVGNPHMLLLSRSRNQNTYLQTTFYSCKEPTTALIGFVFKSAAIVSGLFDFKMHDSFIIDSFLP